MDVVRRHRLELNVPAEPGNDVSLNLTITEMTKGLGVLLAPLNDCVTAHFEQEVTANREWGLYVPGSGPYVHGQPRPLRPELRKQILAHTDPWDALEPLFERVLELCDEALRKTAHDLMSNPILILCNEEASNFQKALSVFDRNSHFEHPLVKIARSFRKQTGTIPRQFAYAIPRNRVRFDLGTSIDDIAAEYVSMALLPTLMSMNGVDFEEWEFSVAECETSCLDGPQNSPHGERAQKYNDPKQWMRHVVDWPWPDAQVAYFDGNPATRSARSTRPTLWLTKNLADVKSVATGQPIRELPARETLACLALVANIMPRCMRILAEACRDPAVWLRAVEQAEIEFPRNDERLRSRWKRRQI